MAKKFRYFSILLFTFPKARDTIESGGGWPPTMTKEGMKMSVSTTSGLYYIVKKFGENDYMLGITEDPIDINEGCSIRGTKEQILKSFEREDEEKEFIKTLLNF